MLPWILKTFRPIVVDWIRRNATEETLHEIGVPDVHELLFVGPDSREFQDEVLDRAENELEENRLEEVLQVKLSEWREHPSDQGLAELVAEVKHMLLRSYAVRPVRAILDVHADGLIRLYGPNRLKVHVIERPKVHDVNAPKMDELIEISIPLLYEDLYYPGQVRATARPCELTIQEIEWRKGFFRAMEKIDGQRGKG